MPEERETRRLSAILAADMVGYSRLMAEAEAATLARLKAHRFELIDPAIAQHRGRVFKTTGDGLLVEFASAVDAVACAAEIQLRMARRNAEMPAGRRIEFRIGVNVGDVIVDGDDLQGDGVNVAARLEGLAEPGGIVIGRMARDAIRDKLDLALDDLGEVEVKNIPRPVRAFRIRLDGAAKAVTARAPAMRFVAWHAALAAAMVVIAAAATYALWPAPRAPVPPAATIAATPVIAIADRPSIAVLAFANLSDDPQQDYLGDGISEDILTALTRFSQIKVIARNSSFAYKGRAADIRQIGRDLNAKYVLEGSVRRIGEQIRMTAQLIESTTGAHVWAERYERPMRDIFQVQDEVVDRIARSLVTQLMLAETGEARRRAPTDVTAYDLVLRARDWFRPQTPERLARARELLEQAIRIAPDYADALAWLASVRRSYFINPYNDEYLQASAARENVALAERAVAIDPRSAHAHAVLALVLVDVAQNEAAIAAAERAVSLNPNDADVLLRVVTPLINLGRYEYSLELIETIKLLDPIFPPSLYSIMVRAQIGLHRDADAVVSGRNCVQRAPAILFCHIALVAALGLAGSEPERREAVTALLMLAPSFTVSGEARRSANFPNRVATERYLQGLRAAGVPE